MKRTVVPGLAGLACLTLMAPPALARAMMIAPAPIAQRVATSDLVVVGKVTSIEEKAVKAARFPGAGDTAEYRIALVKVEDAILGARGITHIRVGFLPPPPPPQGGPG